MPQQGRLEVRDSTKILVADIKSKDSKLYQILNDIVRAPVSAASQGMSTQSMLVLMDSQSPPHYWTITIDHTIPTLVLTDVGTTNPIT